MIVTITEQNYEIDFEILGADDIVFVSLNRKVPEHVEPLGDTFITDDPKRAMEILSMNPTGWAKLEKMALDQAPVDAVGRDPDEEET